MFKSKAKKTSQVIPGKLIVVDSNHSKIIEAQEDLLLRACQFTGIPATIFHYPLSTSLGSQLLMEFRGKEGTSVQAEAVFNGIDRFERKKELESILKSGKTVITTNYVLANAVASGCKIESASERISLYKWVHNLEHKVFGLPQPDINFVLLTPGGSDLTINSYQELAKLYPKTKLIPCKNDQSETLNKEVHNIIWQMLRRIVFRDFYERN